MRATVFNIALFLDRVALVAPACLYGLGGAFLAIKFLGVAIPIGDWALALAAGMATAAALAWLLFFSPATERWYSPAYARAWLDLHNRAGGAVMAGVGDNPLAIIPGVSPTYLLKRLALPILFVVAAWAVPAPERSLEVSGAGVEREAGRMERRIDEAEREGALTAMDAEILRRQVERVRDLAQNSPEAAAEAVIALPARLDAACARRLDDMAEMVQRAADVMAEMERPAGSDAEAEGSGANAAALLDAMDRMAEGAGGLDGMSPELAEAIREAMRETGAGSLREMAGGMREGRGMSRESMQRIVAALRESGRQLSAANNRAGEGSKGAESGGVQSLNEALERLQRQGGQMAEGEGPGAGGIDRGPGDAPLTLGEESRQAGMRFENRPLPAGEPSLPDQMLRRERIARPEDMPPEEFRPVWRMAVEAPDRVHAGEAGAGLGPDRARAADRYFMNLGGNR